MRPLPSLSRLGLAAGVDCRTFRLSHFSAVALSAVADVGVCRRHLVESWAEILAGDGGDRKPLRGELPHRRHSSEVTPFGTHLDGDDLGEKTPKGGDGLTLRIGRTGRILRGIPTDITRSGPSATIKASLIVTLDKFTYYVLISNCCSRSPKFIFCIDVYLLLHIALCVFALGLCVFAIAYCSTNTTASSSATTASSATTTSSVSN